MHKSFPSLSHVFELLLTMTGVVALGYYLSWWFQEERLQSIWLLLALVAALAYICFQIISHWFLFWFANFRTLRTSQNSDHLTVDVFITTCAEDPMLVRRCLAAATAMRGKKRVWLLDDGHDPALEQMAHDFDAGYLRREDRKDAKAGNLNAALSRTDGEILAIFDVDHAPLPGYLDATLGHFNDPTVGFVQVMLTFQEDENNWVEHAAIQSSLGFYNPTSTGMDTTGSVTMMGSNSLIRRTALHSIGNYQTGLAEDLATSLALHEHGWRSVYVKEPLAPGLAPPDLTAWFIQQFKWSRGVFEVLLTSLDSTWWKLRWSDRLAYGVRFTMYWLGPVICIHMLATLFVLFSNNSQLTMGYEQYLLHLAPLALCNALIHGQALKRWIHPSLRPQAMWKAIVLVYATWPIYTLAWIMALLRIPLGFRPTPKSSSRKLDLWWLVPQIVSIILLIMAVLFRFAQQSDHGVTVVIWAAIAMALPQILFFWNLASSAEQRTQPKLSDIL